MEGGPGRLADEDLMAEICAGDEAAYEELVRRYQVRLFRFALRRLEDRGTAEDIAQETLFKVWKHRASFRHGSRLSTWIFALCVNLIRDHWRKTKPESSLDRPEVAAAAEASRLRPQRVDALSEAERAQLSELLLEALETLPSLSARLLKARAASDVTLEEAGRALGLGPEAARTAASRAYKRLKEFLNPRLG
jgi:RNA polymerase sigma-70 factor (ECF subfamily)